MNTMNMTKKLLIIIASGIIAISSLLYFIYTPKDQGEDIYKVETFESGNGWGYQIKIRSNEKVIIQQPYMPCVTGNKPFPDEQSASGTGYLILSKLLNGENPSISIEELESVMTN